MVVVNLEHLVDENFEVGISLPPLGLPVLAHHHQVDALPLLLAHHVRLLGLLQLGHYLHLVVGQVEGHVSHLSSSLEQPQIVVTALLTLLFYSRLILVELWSALLILQGAFTTEFFLIYCLLTALD